MKRVSRKPIAILLAAVTALLLCCAFLTGRGMQASAQEALRESITAYYETLTKCISDGTNPMDDHTVKEVLRSRLSDFQLTDRESDAVIATLQEEELNASYRNLYLLSIFDYECSTKENHANSYYSAEENMVHIGKNVAPNNFLVTFFHESAHAIEIHLWDKTSSSQDITDSFLFESEKNVISALEDDVRDRIIQVADDWMAAEEVDVPDQAIADAFVNGDPEVIITTDAADGSGMIQKNRSISQKVSGNELLTAGYLYVRTYLEEEMENIPGSNASMVSDIYGGITNNKILGNMGHTYSYYWYQEDGTPTYNQLAEAWAEFFAAMITGDEANIKWNITYFPRATLVLEELAEQLYTYYYTRERN